MSNSKQAESQIAKALFYIHKTRYNEAVSHLEKALEYNPNSGLTLHFLTELYHMYLPNTSKYLEYALQKARLGVTAHDSVTTSYDYLHLGNALLQAGFLSEALTYINKAADYFPGNPYVGYIKAFIYFARDRDLQKTKYLLSKELNKDTGRIDILQEMGKICYLMQEYEEAHKYYKRFMELKEKQQLDIYRHENLKIAIVLDKTGRKEKSRMLIEDFKVFADQDQSMYKHLLLAGYYAYHGNTAKAVDHMELFAEEDHYVYWILLWETDAVFDPVKDHPEFSKVMQDIETRFWDDHKEIREKLEKEGLL